MIQNNGSDEFNWVQKIECGSGEQKAPASDWTNALGKIDTCDTNTFIKSKLSPIKLLSREQEREAAQKLERCVSQIALLNCTHSVSAYELVSLVSCALGSGLKKYMLSSEDRYFALRREMDDLVQAPENIGKLNQFMALKEVLKLSDRRFPLSLVKLIASIDWPRALMFALAKRHGAFKADKAVLDRSIDEYLTNFHSPMKISAPLEPEHQQQLDCFAAAYLRARDGLVTHNLRLVYHIAKRYAQKSEQLPDLVQEGTFGLVRAAEKYRLASGFRFSTYAHYWIDSKIRKLRVNLDKLVHISHEANNDLLRVTQYIERHKALGTKPSESRICKETNISAEKLSSILQLRQFGISLDDKGSDDDSFSLHATLPDVNSDFAASVMEERCANYIDGVMQSQLTKREIYIVNERFGRIGSDPRTLQELSDILGISRERVRQLEIKALQKLSECIDRDALS